jgi:hypothetical protein
VDLAAEVVTAIASGAGGSIGTTGAQAIGRLISALRTRFLGQPAERGILEISLESPGNATAKDQPAIILRDHIRGDAEFEEWLASLWTEIQTDLQASVSNSTNVITGTVHGSVIQARDVHGGIHLDGP